MRKLITYVKDGIITIQQAEYQEDGWYISVKGSAITLFEIPYGGGKETVIGVYDTIIEAINVGKSLT